MRTIVILVSLAACGRLGFDATTAGDGGASGDDAVGDGNAAVEIPGDTYVKPAVVDPGDHFGASVALSETGATLAVGAWGEAGDGGINGDATSNALPGAGAVYVFQVVDGAWQQEAYLKASDVSEDANLGWSVAISADGNTIAAGAIEQGPTPNGAIYVFTRSSGVWTEQAILEGLLAQPPSFGLVVALSRDGNTLATTGGNGTVEVFVRSGVTWMRQTALTASNGEASDGFGLAMALSENGDVCAVGAPLEAGASRSMPLTNTVSSSGAVYVFARTGTAWTEEMYVKADVVDSNDEFGDAVALDASGGILVVGAPREDSNARGFNGDASNNSANSAGAAYIFERAGGTWPLGHYVKTTNADGDDLFGYHIAMSAGRTFVAVAPGESSGATWADGDQFDNSVPRSGAGYLFSFAGGWQQTRYFKPPRPRMNIELDAVAINQDGSVVAFGQQNEGSAATGIGGDPDDNSAFGAGAVFVFHEAP